VSIVAFSAEWIPPQCMRADAEDQARNSLTQHHNMREVNNYGMRNASAPSDSKSYKAAYHQHLLSHRACELPVLFKKGAEITSPKHANSVCSRVTKQRELCDCTAHTSTHAVMVVRQTPRTSVHLGLCAQPRTRQNAPLALGNFGLQLLRRTLHVCVRVSSQPFPTASRTTCGPPQLCLPHARHMARPR